MGKIPSIWSVYACLDVITSEKECKVNKDYKKHIVKVKKPKRRKKRDMDGRRKGQKTQGEQNHSKELLIQTTQKRL